MKIRGRMVILIGLILIASLPSPTPAYTSGSSTRLNAYSCPVTLNTFYIYGRICQFWAANGDTYDFGLPIGFQSSESIEVSGNMVNLDVQWFERHRLELHPENAGTPYDVLLGLMGVLRLTQQGRSWVAGGESAHFGCDFWPETGYNDCTPFSGTWRNRGVELDGLSGKTRAESLALYGMPITSVNMETNSSGDTVPTQWFQRARFEHHTKNAPPYNVLLGRLGVELRQFTVALAIVSLSSSEDRSLRENAEKNKIKLDELALDRVALYGIENAGAALLLTPLARPPDIPAGQLAANPAAIDQIGIGGLSVVRQIHPNFLPDNYVVTLTPDGEWLLFTGANNKVELPAVIRELPVPLPAPTALITAREICFPLRQALLCGKIPTPPPEALVEQLREGVQELGVDPSAFALDLAVPIVDGEAELETCVAAIRSDKPNYQPCGPTIAGAPAIADGAFPAPPEKGTITGIGVLQVLKTLREDAFDSDFTKRVFDIPAGTYLVYEVQRDDDRMIAEGIRATRIRLVGRNGDFYLPAINAGSLLGKVVRGDDPSGQNEAASAGSLFIRGRCFLNAGRCPARR